MTDPTDPTDPTGPTGSARPDDPIEARVRDALGARADGVEPGPADPAVLDAAVAADARTRLRRNRVLLATGAAAAVLLVIGGVALAGRSTEGDKVITGSDPDPAHAATTTTEPFYPGDTTTIVDTTTTTTTAVPTTQAPTSTTTEVPPTTTTTVVPALPGATTGARSGGGTGFPPATATAVRVGCNTGYDRIVFEFADGLRPAWSVQYVQPPIIEDATGNALPLAGPDYLQIRMDGASGHDLETGTPTITTSAVSGGCPAVSRVNRTGDFEGVFTWVADVNGELPFTVSTLSGPSRLVIDVAHPA